MKTVLASLGFLVVAATLVIVAVVIFVVGTINREVSLRNQFDAQLKINETVFDNTWKIIEQNSQVAKVERESLRETLVEVMSARKGLVGSGSLASFLTEAKIDVNSDLYSKLMTTIETNRNTFQRSQEKLVSLKQEHQDIRLKFPGSLIVGGRPELELKLVTSSKTDEAFESGKENDVELFK